MDINLADKFIKSISKDTLNGKISWKRMIDLEKLSPNSNEELYMLMFQNEYHHVNLTDSFYAPITNGTLYILDETSESGRDGTIISGHSAYIQEEDTYKIFQVECPQSRIYQLLNSINAYLGKNDMEADNFINLYFQSNN